MQGSVLEQCQINTWCTTGDGHEGSCSVTPHSLRVESGPAFHIQVVANGDGPRYVLVCGWRFTMSEVQTLGGMLLATERSYGAG